MPNGTDKNGYVRFKMEDLKSAIVVLVKVLGIAGAAVGGGYLADFTAHKTSIVDSIEVNKAVTELQSRHDALQIDHDNFTIIHDELSEQTRKLEAWQIYNTCLFRRHATEEPMNLCNELALIYPEIRELINILPTGAR